MRNKSNLLMLLAIFLMLACFFAYCFANKEIYVQIDKDWTDEAHAEYSQFINHYYFVPTESGVQRQGFQLSIYEKSSPSSIILKGETIMLNDMYRFVGIPEHWFSEHPHIHERQAGSSQEKMDKGKREMTLEMELQHKLEQAALRHRLTIGSPPEIVLEIRFPEIDAVIKRKFYLGDASNAQKYVFSILPEQWACCRLPISSPELHSNHLQRLLRNMNKQEIMQRISSNTERQEQFQWKLYKVREKYEDKTMAKTDLENLIPEVHAVLLQVEQEYQLQYVLLMNEEFELRNDLLRRQKRRTGNTTKMSYKLLSLLEESKKKQLTLLPVEMSSVKLPTKSSNIPSSNQPSYFDKVIAKLQANIKMESYMWSRLKQYRQKYYGQQEPENLIIQHQMTMEELQQELQMFEQREARQQVSEARKKQQLEGSALKKAKKSAPSTSLSIGHHHHNDHLHHQDMLHQQQQLHGHHAPVPIPFAQPTADGAQMHDEYHSVKMHPPPVVISSLESDSEKTESDD